VSVVIGGVAKERAFGKFHTPVDSFGIRGDNGTDGKNGTNGKASVIFRLFRSFRLFRYLS
jgi:hypothetical protein